MANSKAVILIVDDDESFLQVVAIILRRGGYMPITACGPLEALEKSHDFKGKIHLLLTDIAMPEMHGPLLAQVIVSERPDIRVMLMSGCISAPFGLPIIKKPFGMPKLLAEVTKLIETPPTP